MKKLPGLMAAFGLAFAFVTTDAHGVAITQWNFNGTTGMNNAPAPSVGAGSATPVGMTGGANNADIVAAGGSVPSSDPGLPNNSWRVRGSTSNGWSGATQLLSGAQFNVSTAGTSDIVVGFDLHATDGSPRHGQFQYTVDGTNFTSFGALLDFNATFDGWAPFSFDLSAVPGVSNNPQFGFKLVSAFSPVEFTNANGVQPANTAFQRASATAQVYNGTAGNWRFDMVTVSSVPEPSSLALGALGIAALRRRRVR
jgi:MYXO-CTERM domain-containing protein